MNSWTTSSAAAEDLLDIYLSGIRDFGRQQAVRYVRELEHVFELLAETPRMGRKADAIRVGIRRHEHGAHVILYEETDAGVRILAVIHSASLRGLRL